MPSCSCKPTSKIPLTVKRWMRELTTSAPAPPHRDHDRDRVADTHSELVGEHAPENDIC
jgi:hypothetical protein